MAGGAEAGFTDLWPPHPSHPQHLCSSILHNRAWGQLFDKRVLHQNTEAQKPAMSDISLCWPLDKHLPAEFKFMFKC